MGERPVSGRVERSKSRGEDGTDVVQGRGRVEVGTVRRKR